MSGGIPLNKVEVAFGLDDQISGALANMTILAFLGKITSASAKFEQQMANAQSIFLSSMKDFQKLQNQVLSLGGKTTKSLTDVAKAMYDLASAGLKADESMTVLNQTLKLAEATNSDIGTTTKLVVKTIKAFNLEMTDAGDVSNLFANAINKSQLKLEDIAGAMKYTNQIGATFKKQTLEETIGAMSVLADKGINANIGMRMLRSAFATLSTPTAKLTKFLDKYGLTLDDVNTRTNSYIKVLQKLKDVGASPEDLANLFGKRAIGSVSILLDQGTEKLVDYTAKIKSATDMTQMLAMQQNTLDGALKLLSTTWEEFRNKTLKGTLIDFQSMAEAIQGILGGLNELKTSEIKIGGLSASLSDVLSPLTAVLSVMTVGGGIAVFGKIIGSLMKFASLTPQMLGFLATAGVAITIFSKINKEAINADLAYANSITKVSDEMGKLVEKSKMYKKLGMENSYQAQMNEVDKLKFRLKTVQKIIQNLRNQGTSKLVTRNVGGDTVQSLEYNFQDKKLDAQHKYFMAMSDSIITKISELKDKANFTGISETMKGLGNDVTNYFETLQTNATDLFTTFFDVNARFEYMSKDIMSAFQTTDEYTKKQIDYWTSLKSNVVLLQDIASKNGVSVQSLMAGIDNKIASLRGKFKDITKAEIPAFTDSINIVGDVFKNVFGSGVIPLIDNVKDHLTDMYSETAKKLRDDISAIDKIFKASKKYHDLQIQKEIEYNEKLKNNQEALKDYAREYVKDGVTITDVQQSIIDKIKALQDELNKAKDNSDGLNESLAKEKSGGGKSGVKTTVTYGGMWTPEGWKQHLRDVYLQENGARLHEEAKQRQEQRQQLADDKKQQELQAEQNRLTEQARTSKLNRNINILLASPKQAERMRAYDTYQGNLSNGASPQLALQLYMKQLADISKKYTVAVKDNTKALIDNSEATLKSAQEQLKSYQNRNNPFYSALQEVTNAQSAVSKETNATAIKNLKEVLKLKKELFNETVSNTFTDEYNQAFNPMGYAIDKLNEKFKIYAKYVTDTNLLNKLYQKSLDDITKSYDKQSQAISGASDTLGEEFLPLLVSTANVMGGSANVLTNLSGNKSTDGTSGTLTNTTPTISGTGTSLNAEQSRYTQWANDLRNRKIRTPANKRPDFSWKPPVKTSNDYNISGNDFSFGTNGSYAGIYKLITLIRKAIQGNATMDVSTDKGKYDLKFYVNANSKYDMNDIMRMAQNSYNSVYGNAV